MCDKAIFFQVQPQHRQGGFPRRQERPTERLYLRRHRPGVLGGSGRRVQHPDGGQLVRHDGLRGRLSQGVALGAPLQRVLDALQAGFILDQHFVKILATLWFSLPVACLAQKLFFNKIYPQHSKRPARVATKVLKLCKKVVQK